MKLNYLGGFSILNTYYRHCHLWLKRKPLYDKEAEGEILISSLLPQSRGPPGPGRLGGYERAAAEYRVSRVETFRQEHGL